MNMTKRNGAPMGPITTREAQIKTCAVEVKAITISGKQVTLAVFRQLTREQIINVETGQFLGTPWGRVNYNPGDCDVQCGSHLHVVWQKGTELRRACVERKQYVRNGPEKRLFDQLERLQTDAADYARWQIGMRKKVKTTAYPRPDFYDLDGWRFYRGREQFRVLEKLWGSSNDSLDGPNEVDDRLREIYADSRAEALSLAASCYESLIDAEVDIREGSPDDCSRCIRELDERADRMRADWAARYDELAALDQLFIAV
jgi:hypothetical protein